VWWYQSSKTAKIIWVTLDGAMHMASLQAYTQRPMSWCHGAVYITGVAEAGDWDYLQQQWWRKNHLCPAVMASHGTTLRRPGYRTITIWRLLISSTSVTLRWRSSTSSSESLAFSTTRSLSLSSSFYTDRWQGILLRLIGVIITYNVIMRKVSKSYDIITRRPKCHNVSGFVAVKSGNANVTVFAI